MNKKDWLHKLLSKKFAEQEAPVDNFLWNNIEAELHPQKKRRGLIFWWGLGGGIVIVGIIASLLLFSTPKTQSIANSKNTIEQTENNTTNENNISKIASTNSDQNLTIEQYQKKSTADINSSVQEKTQKNRLNNKTTSPSNNNLEKEYLNVKQNINQNKPTKKNSKINASSFKKEVKTDKTSQPDPESVNSVKSILAFQKIKTLFFFADTQNQFDTINIQPKLSYPSSDNSCPAPFKWTIGQRVGTNRLRLFANKSDDLIFLANEDNTADFEKRPINLSTYLGVEKMINNKIGFYSRLQLSFTRHSVKYRLKTPEDPMITARVQGSNQIQVNVIYQETEETQTRNFAGLANESGIIFQPSNGYPLALQAGLGFQFTDELNNDNGLQYNTYFSSELFLPIGNKWRISLYGAFAPSKLNWVDFSSQSTNLQLGLNYRIN